jgi:membrane-bound lytic murein transglycosylase D
MVALAATAAIPLFLFGCSVPGPTARPYPKLGAPLKENAFRRSQEKPPPPALTESAPGQVSESGEQYASLPPVDKGVRPRIKKKAEPTIAPFTLVKNREVEKYIKYFRDERRGTFRKWLERYGRYGPLMRKIFREHGLPEDLVFVSLVESGLSPYAYSRARATGPWQFISSTGRKYGMTINWWIDERRDPTKSTYAAARYLKDLYQMFDSWPLALAGYNAGEYRVKNAIQRVGSRDFWRIARTRYLKRETRQYVPKIMAAAIIAKNPRRYGFSNIDYQKPLRYHEVELERPTDLRLIARSVGTSYEEIKTLNPELKRGVTPPNYPGYAVKVPYGTAARLVTNLKKTAARRPATWQRHRVRSGQTLSQIASLYGSSVSAIMELNKLNNPHRIYVGDNILIPVMTREATKASLVSAGGGAYDAGNSADTFSYKIMPGDNLSDIAKEFGVSLEDVMRVNNLRNPHLIYAGKEIILPAIGVSSFSIVKSAAATARRDVVSEDRVEMVSHRVRRGETLSSIALRYGVEMKEIVRVNGIGDVNSLREKQTLKIPLTVPDGALAAVDEDGTASSGSLVIYKGGRYRKVFHTIRKGDTLWEIARSYDVNLKELRRWNGLRGGQHIYPGDVLHILIAQK